MVTFSVSIKEQEGKTNEEEKYFPFSVPEMSVLFAGSRYLKVPQRTCQDLVQQFAEYSFSFLVGCADGVDRSFRKALAYSPYKDRCFVACAFPNRVKYSYSYGLFASVVVPQNLPPKAALHRRTVWLVRRCSMAVLFPESPFDNTWGKGSRLAFRASMHHLKPAFVVCSFPPKDSIHYRILPSSLFGVVKGYWVIPYPVCDGGTCGEGYLNEGKRRRNKMKSMRGIKITIKKVESRNREYIAYHTSDFLNATFSVYFKDDTFGAMALHEFSEMIKKKYEKEKIEFVVSEEKMRFKSRDLLEVMTGSELHQ